jgi:hypothetical protein
MNSAEQVLVQGHGGSPNPLDKDGLCLLSLDGGGFGASPVSTS